MASVRISVRPRPAGEDQRPRHRARAACAAPAAGELPLQHRLAPRRPRLEHLLGGELAGVRAGRRRAAAASRAARAEEQQRRRDRGRQHEADDPQDDHRLPALRVRRAHAERVVEVALDDKGRPDAEGDVGRDEQRHDRPRDDQEQPVAAGHPGDSRVTGTCATLLPSAVRVEWGELHDQCTGLGHVRAPHARGLRPRGGGALLVWDEQTYCSKSGHDSRAYQQAALASLRARAHRRRGLRRDRRRARRRRPTASARSSARWCASSSTTATAPCA